MISPNGRLDDFPSVYIDDYHLMEEAISYIYSKGYRYVYHLTRKTELKFEKETGFLHALQSNYQDRHDLSALFRPYEAVVLRNS